ncbi:MAG: class I SAM-dependent methyltransferase [Bacteroidota bacterium]
MTADFYYNSRKNVQDYIKMARPYDGRFLIRRLEKHLNEGASILELGMGPGKDMDLLSRKYKVTGTDLSKVFVSIYKKKNPGADLHVLDAHQININRKFDCIFSNKTLHHLSKKELRESILRQHEILNPGGIILHSFWEGDREEVLSGLLFVYYRKKYLEELFSRTFTLISSDIFSEVFEDDSIYILAQKNP